MGDECPNGAAHDRQEFGVFGVVMLASTAGEVGAGFDPGARAAGSSPASIAVGTALVAACVAGVLLLRLVNCVSTPREASRYCASRLSEQLGASQPGEYGG